VHDYIKIKELVRDLKKNSSTAEYCKAWTLGVRHASNV